MTRTVGRIDGRWCEVCDLLLPPETRRRDARRHRRLCRQKEKERVRVQKEERSLLQPGPDGPMPAPLPVSHAACREEDGGVSLRSPGLLVVPPTKPGRDVFPHKPSDRNQRSAAIAFDLNREASGEGKAEPECTLDEEILVVTLPAETGATPTVRPSIQGASRLRTDRKEKTTVGAARHRESSRSKKAVSSRIPGSIPADIRVASRVCRVACHPPSDVEPDDYVCVDPPRRFAIPVALGAPRPDRSEAQGACRSGSFPLPCVIVSDEDEPSSSEPSGPRSPDPLPDSASRDLLSKWPLLEGSSDTSTAVTVSVPVTVVPWGAPPSVVGPPSKDTIACHICPAKFAGTDAKIRIRHHIESHFQRPTPSTPCHVGSSSSQPSATAHHERRIEVKITTPVAFRPVPIEPLHFATRLASVCDDVHPETED